MRKSTFRQLPLYPLNLCYLFTRAEIIALRYTFHILLYNISIRLKQE